ncbi:uncharacterized protein LOC143222374 isoform X2 [Tachypleus tridentatus]|uniref:uncharacterized protein LOC143222374 isoform X2 n=1 Tax=Tachypleus tridentatus TaxID=6853 RepID=UPI003FD67CCC
MMQNNQVSKPVRFLKKIKERSLSRRRVCRRRIRSSTSQEDSELSEGHSESDLEEKNSSDTASCTSGSITEHGVEEEELSDYGEHSGLSVESVTSTAVDCNGRLEENLTSNKAVLQNGLDCISKSTTSVSLEDKDNTENEHSSNGDVQSKSEGSNSVSGIVTLQSLVEQELTPSVVEVIKIINQEGLLPGIKVVADWLIINSDIIVTYGEGVEQPVGQRKQMMRNMAHLWLKAEVNDLESKVKKGGFPQLSPYLVPDISSFCQHLALLKQLRLSKRFVIVVASVVTASLDERKKECVGVREAIRWLENELRHGTKRIRQRLVSRPRMFKLRAVARILKTRPQVPIELGSMLINSTDHLHLLFQIFHHYHLFL